MWAGSLRARDDRSKPRNHAVFSYDRCCHASLLLNECLRNAVESSFNRITIDGHMSTNDTIAIMANGASRVNITSKGPELQIFQEGLNYITNYLAKAIVKDGEGATKFIQIDVVGARSRSDATRIARSIADSPLVKTAINGEDPNWGRIVSAAGYAGVELNESTTSLYINDILIFAKGMPTQSDLNKLSTSMKEYGYQYSPGTWAGGLCGYCLDVRPLARIRHH